MNATILQRSEHGESAGPLAQCASGCLVEGSDSGQPELRNAHAPGQSSSAATDQLPFVSVIVPHYNNPSGLVSLLERLERQSYPHDRFECILVDNGSEQPPGTLPSTTFAVRLSDEPRPGSYSARNRGLELARGEVLAFTDSDCLPAPDWIECGVRTLLRQETPAVVGGRIQLISEQPDNLGIVELYNLATTFLQSYYIERLGFAATANVLAPREVLRRVGNFDATLLSGGDREWCFRLRRAGIPLIYDDLAVVEHPSITDWTRLVQRCQRITGGIYELQVRSGWGLFRICADQWLMLCRRIRKLSADPQWRTWRHFPRLVVMELAMRILHVGECVRLRLGGTPERI